MNQFTLLIVENRNANLSINWIYFLICILWWVFKNFLSFLNLDLLESIIL